MLGVGLDSGRKAGKMPRADTTWLITDTHLFHERMTELCGRPADFTDRIVTNLQKVMYPQDMLIHLGDVIFYKMEMLDAILDLIPGTKVLVKGNHDKKSNNWYRRNGFHVVVDALRLGDVYLTHKPVETLPDGVRINVHGHWHNKNIAVPEWWSAQTHRLLAVEHTQYFPVRLHEFAR
jgi:calcineurin-like phosphoesterase family protein